MNYMFITPNKMDGKRISYDYVVQRYEIQQILKEYTLISLGDICEEITSGLRVNKKYYVAEKGYKVITPGDIKDGIVYISHLKRVQPEIVKEKDIVNSGDILITASGKSGQVIYTNEVLEGCVVTSDIIKITLNDKNKSIRLYKFLKSGIGQILLNSIKRGILNKIFVEDIKNLLIPKEFDKYQEDCPYDFMAHIEAEKIYKSAENIFYKVFDYKGEEDNLKHFYVKKFLDSCRLDPAYYSNFYTEWYKLINKNIKGIEWYKLGELVEIKKADKPKICENQKVKYFLLADIDPHFSIIKEIHEDFYGNLSNRMRYIVRSGEIVTAKSGSATGTKGHATALITEEFDGMVTTDAFFNIIPENIDRYYLLFLLKQPIILNQIKMIAKGNIYKMIQRSDFEKIKIPRIKIKYEKHISEKMRFYLSENQKLVNFKKGDKNETSEY